MTNRQVKFITRGSNKCDAHGGIELLGGNYLGWPWLLSTHMVIHYIKNRIEEYYITESGQKIAIVVDVHEGREFLKTETDSSTPDNLLALPEAPYNLRLGKTKINVDTL